MQIRFTRLSDDQHRVEVTRADGSTEEATLPSREFLRHDFAHLAAESCVGLSKGYWGSVASGAGLDGSGMGGPEIQLAEALAGPIQTLLRTDANLKHYEATLARVLPDRDCRELAAKVHERGRQLQGHWRATPFGESMEVQWDEEGLTSD